MPSALNTVRLVVDDRPRKLAVVTIAPASYHLALLSRIAVELDGWELNSIFTTPPDARTAELPPSINAAYVGPGVEFTSSPFRALRRLRGEWRTARDVAGELERIRCDVAVVNGWGSLAYLSILSRCHRRRITVLVRGDFNVHALTQLGAIQRWVRQRLIGWVDRRTAGFLAVGSAGVRYLSLLGVDPSRVFVVPLEPDYGRFAHGEPESDRQTVERLGLAPDRRRLLFVGRLAPEKRVDLAIDAFSRIAEQRPDWDLVIAGAGPLEEELRARVLASLADRVSFLGFFPNKQLPAIYQASHALVLPSDSEQWGLVVNEALAAGLPVIASSVVGAAMDLIDDGVSGCIVPPGDAGSLADAMLRVTDPIEGPAMTQQATSVLEVWRRRRDPVAGLRAALDSVPTSDREASA